MPKRKLLVPKTNAATRAKRCTTIRIDHANNAEFWMEVEVDLNTGDVTSVRGRLPSQPFQAACKYLTADKINRLPGQRQWIVNGGNQALLGVSDALQAIQANDIATFSKAIRHLLTAPEWNSRSMIQDVFDRSISALRATPRRLRKPFYATLGTAVHALPLPTPQSIGYLGRFGKYNRSPARVSMVHKAITSFDIDYVRVLREDAASKDQTQWTRDMISAYRYSRLARTTTDRRAPRVFVTPDFSVSMMKRVLRWMPAADFGPTLFALLAGRNNGYTQNVLVVC